MDNRTISITTTQSDNKRKGETYNNLKVLVLVAYGTMSLNLFLCDLSYQVVAVAVGLLENLLLQVAYRGS